MKTNLTQVVRFLLLTIVLYSCEQNDVNVTNNPLVVVSADPNINAAKQ